MITVDFCACITAALMLLVLPLNWLSAAFFAAVWHEFSHVLMIFAMKGRIFHIRIGLSGARMETEPMVGLAAFLCAIAGPIGSFLLLLLSDSFPRLAVCGFVQGFYNLLPIYPLDGGRVLQCILDFLIPKFADRVQRWVEVSVLVLILVAFLLAVNDSFVGIWTVLFPLIIIIKCFLRKIPCKQTRIGVQ